MDVSSGIERDPIATYIPLDHAGQNGQGIDSDAKSDNGRLRKVQELSERLRKKLRTKDAGDPNEHNEDMQPRSPSAAPVLAPEPSGNDQQNRFSDERPGKSTLVPFKEFVHSPIAAMKSITHRKGGKEFAEKVADSDASHSANVRLVLAHERLNTETSEKGQEDAQQDLELQKKIRQDAFVRWTMARHVRKVKNMQLQGLPSKEEERFIWAGNTLSSRWLTYVHYQVILNMEKHGARYICGSSELPEPTSEALITSCERLLLTSVPLQNLFMKLLSISSWEEPKHTAGCALLYFTLCWLNYVPRGVILYYIYSTLKNRYYPRTVVELREKLERSEDSSQTAQDITELIEQHGTRGWADALITNAGPTIQLGLEDLANYMEVLKNFHEWRDPRRTAISLALLFSLWLVITVTPVWLLVKSFFFGIGFAFFVIVPISSRWPQYRLLVSPFTWLFWKVPTNGEWAIARLQAEAAQQLSPPSSTQATTNANKPNAQDHGEMPAAQEEPFIGPLRKHRDRRAPSGETQDVEPEVKLNIGEYHCIYANSHGKLSLSTQRAHFETQVTKTEKWSIRYSELLGIEKRPRSTSMKTSGDDIALTDSRGIEYHLSAITHRDEAFTQIVGYSSVSWLITG